MNRLLTWAATGTLALGLLSACESMGSNNKGAQTRAAQDQSGPVATAQIRPSQLATTRPSVGQPSGTVRFTQMGDQVRIVADITGLKPNTTHGFHIHEKGDLSAPDLSSAGGHYNPESHPHAGPESTPRHAGDLGNLEADAQGRAHKEMTVSNVSVNGQENPIVGKAVIIHAQADDLTSQPSGAAGDRIGGGIIELQD